MHDRNEPHVIKVSSTELNDVRNSRRKGGKSIRQPRDNSPTRRTEPRRLETMILKQ